MISTIDPRKLKDSLLKVKKKWHSLDLYPKLQRNVSNSQRFFAHPNRIDSLKTMFWDQIARKTPGLRNCYEYTDLSKAPSSILDLVHVGHSSLHDFFELEAYSQVITAVHSATPNHHGHSSTWKHMDPEISKLFDNQLKEVTSFLFKKTASSSALFHHEESTDGSSNLDKYSDPHVCAWHCDRYIPCLKAIYFPFGCNWLPFEIIEADSREYLNRTPKSVMKMFFNKLPAIFKENSLYQSFVPPNTLLLTFNHLFHRRGEFSGAGSRSTIFLDWWNSFTYIDLIRQAIFR